MLIFNRISTITDCVAVSTSYNSFIAKKLRNKNKKMVRLELFVLIAVTCLIAVNCASK